jgi:aryl-alcohol dehydrogenase-like predicted oxidoreductase
VPGHSGGESETILGNWLKARGNRERLVIATKVGNEMPSGKGLSRRHIERAVEDSLRRLQTDYIDLYQSHIDDAATPLEETLSAYARLTEQGKVRAIGASNYSAERLAEALRISAAGGLPRYESLQPNYNLYDRADFERALEPLCEREGVGVINYFALASGFLTGKYRSAADFGKSQRGQGMQPYLNERGLRILAALDAAAAEYDATPARIALAWLLARPSITAPIASATTLEQVQELIAATRLRLAPETIARLNEASAPT